MSDSRLEIVIPARSPPGNCHTATASTRTIAMLRRCLPRSGPTTPRIALGPTRRPARRRWAPPPPRGRAPRLGGGAPVDVLGGEPVADAEVRVDVAPVRRDALELLAQLAHEHVHRAVAVRHRVAPHALVDLLALEHLAGGLGQQLQELELAAREVEALPADERLELVAPDL